VAKASYTQQRLRSYIDLGWEDPGLTTADARRMLEEVQTMADAVAKLTAENERLQEVIENAVEERR
jgi:hypothetical protein